MADKIKENENVVQYANDENFQKLFITTLEGVDVSWESSKISNDFETSGKLNVEWGVQVMCTSHGMMMKPFVNKVSGVLTAEHIDTDERDKNRKYSFTSDGYDIRNDIDFESASSRDGYVCQLKISNVYINFNKKYIMIS